MLLFKQIRTSIKVYTFNNRICFSSFQNRPCWRDCA